MTTKKKHTRRRRRHLDYQLTPEWEQAWADVWASVSVHWMRNLNKRPPRAVYDLLYSLIPDAQRFLKLCGGTHHKNCRCRAYAMFVVNAERIAKNDVIPPSVIFQQQKRAFDAYISGRN